MEPRNLGASLAQIRRRQGVSLRELSRAAGLAPASLSAIERGGSSPTLASLHKILKALGTDFAGFFAESPGRRQAPVFPAAGMRTVRDAHRAYRLLFPKSRELRFEIVEETLAGSERESEWEVHDCDLGGVVLAGGPVRLEIEGQGEWRMSRGDAFYVKAGQRHRALNLGSRPVKLITVWHPPKY